MPVPDHYATVRAAEDSVTEARITKAKLGVTWTEFLEQAATALDPEEGGELTNF